MKRLHVHVGVNDLDQSIRFYSALFAAEPTVKKNDYAKWMLDDPRVNFAISYRPDAGGVPISSFTWNGVDFLDGAWVGGSFPVPVPVTSATTYFVGISGWDNALGWAGQNSGAGINWVDAPVGAPADNLGAGSSWGSTNGTSGVYDIQFSPGTLGATDQPVIRFLSDVPNPATVSMLGLAACGGLIRRRR